MTQGAEAIAPTDKTVLSKERSLDLGEILQELLGNGAEESVPSEGQDGFLAGLGNLLDLLGVTTHPLSQCEIKAIPDQAYTGQPVTPSITISYQGTRLKKNTDYTVKYSNNTKVGTARVTLTGKGSFTGTRSVSFKIVRKTSSRKKPGTSGQTAKLSVSLSKTSYVYDGKEHRPTVKVTVKGKTVTKADYTLTYKNNKNVGIALVTVKGKGDYKNLTGEATFKITLKKIGLRSLSKGKEGEAKASWNIDTQADGYELSACTNKGFGSGTVKAKVTDCRISSYLFESLKSKKKYYIRIRSYKKVGSSVWYSTWSAPKEITVP